MIPDQDSLAPGEFAHVYGRGRVYLDYAGAGVASASQIQAHARRVASACFGNPHSDDADSHALIERSRAAVLRFFNAPPDEYAVIFTANATAACRLVAEAFAFGPGARLVLTADNHNCVNGIREFAKRAGAAVVYVPITEPELRTGDQPVLAALNGGGLFAYPAQSNLSGVRHPLEWIAAAQQRGFRVLLDAAALLSTRRLDLSQVKPDYVPVSWYKIFGYPTGVGALVARHEALRELRRPWFSGGTIRAVSVLGGWHSPMDDGTAFEDGTLNFLSIPDVVAGIDFIENIGIERIGAWVSTLTAQALQGLASLRHSNGTPMARVYGPAGLDQRGGTIAFNLLSPQGAVVDERLVVREAAAAGISLRVGCFCNPGAAEAALGLQASQMRALSPESMTTIDGYLEQLNLPSGGMVRISFGVASSASDVARFATFAERTFRDRLPEPGFLPPRIRC